VLAAVETAKTAMAVMEEQVEAWGGKITLLWYQETLIQL
jgi:hypothetical protein